MPFLQDLANYDLPIRFRSRYHGNCPAPLHSHGSDKTYIRPHRKISGIGVSWQKKYGWAEIFLFYFIFYFSDSVCTYVYILEGHWDARHVRPLTSNTHIFCQFYSMQQHADSIIRVNESRADGGEGPRGP